MYLLSTIDGEVIEQTFHVSRLKRGLLRLPNGKSVSNINDYKLEMIWLQQQHVIQPVTPVTDSLQTSVKTVVYTHKNDLSYISHDTDPSYLWYDFFISKTGFLVLSKTLTVPLILICMVKS